MSNIILKEKSYEIIGACMEVHRELGSGFLEPVYQRALEEEFKLRKISFEREKRINILYKGIDLEKVYIADFICNNKVILELKALSKLTNEHEAQLINYLKVTNIKLGILINFGKQSLEYKRIPNKHHRSTNYSD